MSTNTIASSCMCVHAFSCANYMHDLWRVILAMISARLSRSLDEIFLATPKKNSIAPPDLDVEVFFTLQHCHSQRL